MPAAIHIPSRIIVDPESLDRRPACIDDALSRALGRALEMSRRQVLAPRGGYVGVRLNRPQFRWSGPALDQVALEQRAAVEAQVGQIILKQVDATRLLRDVGGGRGGKKPVDPLSGPVFEALDPDRYDAALDLYDIPLYDARGRKGSVKVAPPKTPKPAVEYVERDFWHIVPPDLLKNTRLYNKYLLEMLETWNIPGEGVRGMFWREPDRWILSVHDNDKWYGWAAWDSFGDNRPVKEGNKLVFRRVRTVPSAGVATARLIPASEAREVMKNNIRAKIIEYRQQKGPIGSEFAGQLEDKVEAELKNAFQLAELGALLIEVNAGGMIKWIHAPDGPKWEGIATLAPLTSVQKFKKEVPTDKKDDAAEGGFGDQGAGQGAGGGVGSAEGLAGQGAGKGKPGAKQGTGGESGDKEGKSPDALGGYGAPGGIPGQGELAKAFGFVYTGEEGTGGAGSAFPQSPSGNAPEACDSPLNGEPALKELGADGELLRAVINEIALKLQIQPCEYAARFATIACKVQTGRAVSVSEYAMGENHLGFINPVQPKPGAIGTFEFIPSVSPAVQFMRHLATVTPLISHLTQLIYTVYSKPQHVQRVIGDRYASFTGWFLDFGSPMNGLQKRAVGHIFAMTCRVLLMQLLRSSQKGINDRLDNIAAYAQIFEELIRLQLVDISELIRLRAELRRQVIDKDVLKEVGKELMTTWQDARKALVSAIDFRNPFADIQVGPSQSIVTAPDGTKGIRDSKGKVWSLEELDRTIALQRDNINQIDPLIPQITLDSEVLGRFTRNPQGTREELEKLLREMRGHNRNAMAQNSGDPKYGFRASAIINNTGSATIPGTFYQLTGVHAMAHELIAEFFQGDIYYALGVNSLLRGQEGWEDFKMIVEFVGVTFLSVVCAPLGTALGMVMSLYHRHEAEEKKHLFQSLLDPELVITRAEVEAELFAAELGVLLSFIPESGQILKLGSRVARGAVKGEIRVAARVVARSLRRQVTLDMIKALKGNLAESFAKALVTAQVMNMFLGKLLIEPAVAQMQRDLVSYEQIVAMANQT